MLEVNHSTVQQVVLTRQTKFREDLLGNQAMHMSPVIIASRPAAIYALRSYLRLCMPITIETEINTTVAVFERGGAPALMHKNPMISAKSVGPTVFINPSPRNVSYRRLRNLMLPGGKRDPAIAAYVESLLGLPPKNAGRVLNDAHYAAKYDQIANCIIARNVGRSCPAGSLK